MSFLSFLSLWFSLGFLINDIKTLRFCCPLKLLMTSNARARVRLRGFEVAKKGEDPTVDERNPAKQLIWLISHYLQLFLHPRWLAGFLKHQQYHPRFFESSSLIYYQFNSFIPLLKGFHMFHLSQVVQISSIDSMNTKKNGTTSFKGLFLKFSKGQCPKRQERWRQFLLAKLTSLQKILLMEEILHQLIW